VLDSWSASTTITASGVLSGAALGLADGEASGESVLLGLGDAAGLGDTVGLGDAVGPGDAVGLGDALGEAEGAGVAAANADGPLTKAALAVSAAVVASTDAKEILVLDRSTCSPFRRGRACAHAGDEMRPILSTSACEAQDRRRSRCRKGS
jgi:hypothetical protein